MMEALACHPLGKSRPPPETKLVWDKSNMGV